MHPRDYLVSGLLLAAAALTSGCATSSVLDSGEDGAAAGGTSQRGMLADPGLESAMRTALNQPQGLLDTAAFLSLRELDAAALGIRNLQGIGIAANLRRLVLDYNQLSDLAPLASLVHLRYLELSQNRIQDILSLAHLGALEILDLSANQIEDVAPLADLENLTHLDLDSNEIEDLSPLVGLGNLSVLNLDNNKVHDISSLFGLRRLRNLELSGNPLSDPKHIQQLRQQSVEVHFYIPSVILGDIRLEAAIRRAVDKQEGDLVEDDLLAVRSLLITGAVHSLEGIQGLRNLESLTLHGINSTLADISPLAQVQNLRTVSLNSTWLRHLGPLADLARLEDLKIANNRVESLVPIATLTRLTKLDFSGNQVVDLSPLRGMQRLTSLKFSSNRVHDIPILLDLHNLTIVRLDGNPLSEEARNVHIPALQDAGVVVLGP